MITAERAERILSIISQAWGPTDNTGYCFFPWVEGPDRKFRTRAFEWPEQRDDIIDHLVKHQDDDLYWCPMIFDEPYRRVEHAHEEYALWADLDESDPREIEDRWRPSVAWETSPGRYQALWLLENPNDEDLYGASTAGADNQRMTMMVDADPSGWDTTQLLRLPGFMNHKPQYEVEGEFPRGRLMWWTGPRYWGEDFNDLPEIPTEPDDPQVENDLYEAIDKVSIDEVLDRVGETIEPSVLAEYKRGPNPDEPDLSNRAFFMMRTFADNGCSIAEIVAAITPTPWNKFKGRKTELEDLIRQAKKAFAKRKLKPGMQADYTGMDFATYITSAEPPNWLVKDLISQGGVGFIAGEPKARKSWVALDLALSVAGCASAHLTPFLGQFAIENPGPVIYFVLEDPHSLMAKRAKKVWANKLITGGARMMMEGGRVMTEWTNKSMPLITLVQGQRVSLSDPSSMRMFRQRVHEGYEMPDGDRVPYALVVVDTLMRSVGGSDINDMGDMMNNLLDPLTRMARRNKTTLLIVHHFNKGKTEGDTRGGTRLLGSQALHAWAEDSLYLTAGEHSFGLEVESKNAAGNRWQFNTDPTQRTWTPRLADDTTAPVRNMDFTAVEQPRQRNRDFNPHGKLKNPKVINALYRLGPGAHRCADIAREANMTPPNAHKALGIAFLQGRVEKQDKLWCLVD